jgi:hypothetical protein
MLLKLAVTLENALRIFTIIDISLNMTNDRAMRAIMF